MLHNADKRYNLPIIAHIDLNAKLANMKNLKKFIELKAWQSFQDDQYSWK